MPNFALLLDVSLFLASCFLFLHNRPLSPLSLPMARSLFTSESVTAGHPDKVADIVSDSILDAALAEDPHARVACETGVKTNWAVVFGEITTEARLDYEAIIRKAIAGIGYTIPGIGFESSSCKVENHLEEQSPDIAKGVDAGINKEQGAGDQGIMFGYASNDTPELMPAPIAYAHRLTKQLAKVREERTLPYLLPDGKSQVTFEYENGKPVRINTIVISSHHRPEIAQDQLVDEIRRHVIETICGNLMDDQTIIHINPTGRFEVGGPKGDSGLTGRKIIVDTYGGMGRHGGGAFSGKDPSKVDRSGAYAARYAAKNIVAAGLADKCEIQLGYAIGVAQPVSIVTETFGTGKVSEEKIANAVRTVFDFRPKAIIDQLDLLRPQYRGLAAYGHMGREDLNVAWEKTDRTEALLRAIRG
jgi:S-adenosylmethionine synthetase